MASTFARHGAILEVIGQCKNRKRLREAGGDELSLHSYESSQNYVTYRSRKFVQWECIPFQCAALTAQQCQQNAVLLLLRPRVCEGGTRGKSALGLSYDLSVSESLLVPAMPSTTA